MDRTILSSINLNIDIDNRYRITQVWDHYDADKSGYLEEDEVEVGCNDI